MAISPTDRRRLIGVLMLLSSNHDGERSAAGAAATRMLQRLNLTWEDIIPEDARPQRRPMPDPPPRYQPQWPIWKKWAFECTHKKFALTDWEINFIESLLIRSTISVKQAEALDRICRKVGVP